MAVAVATSVAVAAAVALPVVAVAIAKLAATTAATAAAVTVTAAVETLVARVVQTGHCFQLAHLGTRHCYQWVYFRTPHCFRYEVAYSWLRASKMWPGNGVLGGRRARSGVLVRFTSPVLVRLCPPDAAQTPLGSHDALF